MKIYIFGGNSVSTKIVYNYISKQIDVEKVFIENNESKLVFIKRRIIKLGLFKVIGQLFFRILILPYLNLKSRGRKDELYRQYELNDEEIPSSKLTRIENINNLNLSQVDQEGSLIIVNGTRIIGKKLIKKIKCPIINIHCGITPLFRGVHGGYWAIASGREELFGTTIHLLDAGIDTGKVISQIKKIPSPKDNFSTFSIYQYAIILPELIRVVENYIKSGYFKFENLLEGESHLWSHPTIFEWIKYPKKACPKR